MRALLFLGLLALPAGGQEIVQGSFDRSVVRRVVEKSDTRRCFDEGLRADPELNGRVLVRFVIGPDGSVRGAEIESSDLSRAVNECLLTVARSWRFPKPKSGAVTAVHTFTIRHEVEGFGYREGDKEVIRREIQRHQPQVKACYERELATRPELAGRVLVELTIGAAGDVDAARVAEGDNSVGECIAKASRLWVFPRHVLGGKFIIKYPFILKVAEGEDLSPMTPVPCSGPAPTLASVRERLCGQLYPKARQLCVDSAVEEMKGAVIPPYRGLVVHMARSEPHGERMHVLALEMADGWYACPVAFGLGEDQRAFYEVAARDLLPGGAPEILVRSGCLAERADGDGLALSHDGEMSLCGLGASGKPSCIVGIPLSSQWKTHDGKLHQYLLRPIYQGASEVELRVQSGIPDEQAGKLVGTHHIVFP
jgi:TonB family protein